MKEAIKIQYDVLNNLSDDELKLLINVIPKDALLRPIKARSKEFKTEIAGSRVDLKSKMLVSKLPTIFFNQFKKGDRNIVGIINSYANLVVNTINNRLFNETTNENYFWEAVRSSDIADFVDLVEKILIELKPENIKLFFKLMGHEFTANQNNYIDKDMHLLLEKQILRENIKKDLVTGFEKKALEMEMKNKADISILNDKIKELEKQVKQKEQEILYNQEYLKALDDKLKSNEKAVSSKIITNESTIIQLNKEIEKLTLEASEKMTLMAEQEIIIKSLNDNLNLRFKEYSDIAKKQYEAENEILLNRHRDFENTCARLQQEEKRLKANIEMLAGSVDYWDAVIKEYIQNIDKNIIENVLNRSLLDYSLPVNKQGISPMESPSRPYTKESVTGEKVVACQSINTFSENIASNLETVGVSNIADELANYIIGILASGLTPLICGYKAREIATAISTAYSGETPYIITLPNGYSNAWELTNLYYKAESDSVLIEDGIGSMNENALLPLLRDKSQTVFAHKILILSAENVDSIKYMPMNLYNYIALVSVDKYSVVKNAEYLYSNAQTVLEKFIVDKNFDAEDKKIKYIFKGLKLGNVFITLRANIVAYSHKLSNIKEAVQGYARSELKLICEYKNFYEQIEKNIISNIRDFDNTLLDVIRGDTDE